MDIATYKTIVSTTQVEFKDKGDRFVAFTYPIQILEEVKQYVSILRGEHYKARHWCHAYRLGVGGMQFRANDGGESVGNAGRLISGQTDSAGLTDVLVIVVWCFSGTLLGVPGLIHAYKTAAAEALTVAEAIEKNVEKTVRLRCKYPYLNETIRTTKQNQGNITEQGLQSDCRLTVRLPLACYTLCITAWENTRSIEIYAENSYSQRGRLDLSINMFSDSPLYC